MCVPGVVVLHYTIGLRVLDVDGGCLRATIDVEFVEDVSEIVFHGFLAEIHFGSDFFVGFAFGDEREHAALLRRQGSERVIGTAGFKQAHHARGYGGIENGFARGNIEHGLHKAAAVDFFEKITVAAGANRFVHEMIVHDRSEKKHLGVGQVCEDAATRGETGAVGQADIHQHNIGREFFGSGDTRGDIARFADDLDVAFGGEQRAKSHTDEFAVVDEKEAELRSS